MKSMTFNAHNARRAAGRLALGIVAPAVMLFACQRAFSQALVDEGNVRAGYGRFSSSGTAHESIFASSFGTKGNAISVDAAFGNRRVKVGTMLEMGSAKTWVYAIDRRPGEHNGNTSENSYEYNTVVLAPTITILFPWCSLKTGAGYAAREVRMVSGLDNTSIPVKDGMFGHFEASAWTVPGSAGNFTFIATGNYSAVPEILLGDGSTLSAEVRYTTPTFSVLGGESGVALGLMGNVSNTLYRSESEMAAERMNYARPDNFSPVSAARNYFWGMGATLSATVGRATLSIKHVFSLPGKSGLVEGTTFSLSGTMNTSATISIRLGEMQK